MAENNNEREDQRTDSTEVFDEVDLAQMQAQKQLDELWAAHQQKMKPETHPDFDGENCLDCDNPIPPQRLAMFKIRCVNCQHKLELFNKLHPGRAKS